MGIDILEIDILGIDILGIDIVALPLHFHRIFKNCGWGGGSSEPLTHSGSPLDHNRQLSQRE